MAYLSQKLVRGLIALFLMTAVIFCLQNVIPSDPARLIAGPAAPPATIEALRQQMGINDDLFTRYKAFVLRIAHGDLGVSIRTRQPVASDIGKFLPATIELAVASLALAIPAAILLSVAQAAYPILRGFRLLVLAVSSAPVFLTGMLLVYLVWFRLDVLPGSGRTEFRGFTGATGFLLIDTVLTGNLFLVLDVLSHILLPATVLALPMAAGISQALTASLHDVMRQGYIRTARGNGLGLLHVIIRHGLRNAAGSGLTMTGLQIRLLFGNLLVVERLFGWPGLGAYMVQALSFSDAPAILGVALVLGAFYITLGVTVEVVQRLADPRIRLT